MTTQDDPRDILKSLAEDYRRAFEEIEELAKEGDLEEVFGKLMAAESRLLGEMRRLQMELIGSEGETLKEGMLQFFRMADRLKIVMDFERDAALELLKSSLSEE